ncbi:MAG TPA: gentisate 1,2-dioxygenase [Burkholderiaceae bacterium]|nr:gentisate 1,2-dioxygenase [Burkholderiaceae bacterium]
MHARVNPAGSAAGTDPSAARSAYYERIARLNLKPLWEVLAALVPPAPVTDAVPALWRWQDTQPLLMESGRLITAREAERRVLILENPGLAGQFTCTPTIYAGLQLILPGEVAPAHRHTQSALRFVVDGEGAYTAVDGERVTMSPGDFIVTPMWTWHDHGNPGGEPVIWLDGLDIQVVRLLGAQFRDGHDSDSQSVARPEGDALARYGSNMLPDGFAPRNGVTPIFSYPYRQSRAALFALKEGPRHRCHGVKMRYVNPATGGAPMPTIGTFLQLLPAGFSGAPYRSTDAAVFSVVEGSVRVELDDRRIDAGPKDQFVIPSWYRYRLHAAEDTVLFSFSDRPIQLALHLWREHEGDA